MVAGMMDPSITDAYMRHVNTPEVLPLLCVLAFLMGLGKGGVPGSSTSSVALNVLYAPSIEGGLNLAAALQVPVTFVADVAVVSQYGGDAKMPVVWSLIPPTGIGLVIGVMLMQQISTSQAKSIIGMILGLILMLNLYQEMAKGGKKEATKDKKDDDTPAAWATSWWFAWIIGIAGGFATILTNSMGPLLNVFLLSQKMSNQQFVGTRATFFSCANTIKLLLRIYEGSLSLEMLKLGFSLSLISVLGVFVSRLIVKRMSKTVFMRLEYTLMCYTSLKLLDSGFDTGVFDRLWTAVGWV